MLKAVKGHFELESALSDYTFSIKKSVKFSSS